MRRYQSWFQMSSVVSRKLLFFVVSGCGPLPNVTDGLFTDCTDSLGKPIDTTFKKGNNVTVTYIRTIIRYFLI